MTPLPNAAPLYCSHCGSPTPASAASCPNCGTALPSSTFSHPSAMAVPQFRYAGFWVRFAAIVLDVLIIGALTLPISLYIFRTGIGPDFNGFPGHGHSMVAVAQLLLARVVVFWLYEALLMSSSKQATVGKMALGIRVTDADGLQLTFSRASGRHFAKYISSFLFIGYIMAAFTARKQALHDLIAGTVVIRNS